MTVKRKRGRFSRKMQARAKKLDALLKTSAKRRRKYPRITNMLRAKTYAKLRYVDTVSLDPGIAGITSYVFRCNDIYDPDYTGVGHQPLLRDEYANLYQKYRVLGSTIKVAPVPDSTSAVVPAMYGVFIDSDATLTYSLGTSIIEDKQVRSSWGIHNGFNPNYVGATPKFKSKTWSNKRVAPEHRNDAAAISASPDHHNYFQLWAASINGNDPGSVTFIVQIDYVVEFTDPQTVTPS